MAAVAKARGAQQEFLTQFRYFLDINENIIRPIVFEYAYIVKMSLKIRIKDPQVTLK